MSNLTRYDWDYNQLDHEYNCVECSEGEWVKFDDIKEFLPTGVQQLKAEIRAFLSNSSAMSTIEFYSYISNNAERWRELSAV